MREATAKEFVQAVYHVRQERGGEVRRMYSKRCNDYFYSQVGIPVAEKHEVLSRGKVRSVTYFVDERFLADGTTDDICRRILLGEK